MIQIIKGTKTGRKIKVEEFDIPFKAGKGSFARRVGKLRYRVDELEERVKKLEERYEGEKDFQTKRFPD